MRNRIAIQNGFALIPCAAHENRQLATSLQAELMNLGFMLDADAFQAACQAPREWLVAYHGDIIPYLREGLGSQRDYRPFYRNFPAQVMETSHLELFVNAFVHYLSDGTWEPPQVLRDRGFAFEKSDFRIVRLGTEDNLKTIFARLVSINQSLTPQDKDNVAWFIDTYRGELTLPEVIPFKETLCILAAKGLDVPVKMPTDVLRIAVHLSGGDIALPGVPKPVRRQERHRNQWFLRNLEQAQREARKRFRFRKFKRSERRFILGLLEKTNCDVAEMQRYLGRWLRLGEILHVGEYAERFPRSAEAFQRLRNQRKDSKVRTFHGRVDLAFQRDSREGMELLATRPGEFARKLDWMLRTFEPTHVLEVFGRVGREISSKVLFELYDHFGQRFQEGAPRTIIIRGQRSKMKTLPSLPAMQSDLVQNVGNTILSILTNRMASLPPLGAVWIDERLRQVPVPFAMRSVNTSVRTYVRGTRIPFRPDAKVIRAFIHWHDEEGNQDIDLSAGFYGESLSMVSHISFTHLKDPILNCCHSGDIRHRQGPCAEYVDIDVEDCVRKWVRYVVIHVLNYDTRPMHTVKDCVFGLMERENAQANEIFVPKTISNCMRLANESTSVIVCVLDLKERQYIWADLESERALPMLESTIKRSAEVLKALIHGTRMPVYELLALHAHARGRLVADRAAADVVCTWEEFVTDYAKVASFMAV